MPVNIRNNADSEVSVPYLFTEVSIANCSASNGYTFVSFSVPHFFKTGDAVKVESIFNKVDRLESDGNIIVENAQTIKWNNDIPIANATLNVSSTITKLITQRRRENNQTTLQLSGTHRFIVGDSINVSGLTSGWNGSFNITAIPDNTKVRYNDTGADVLSYVNDSGNISTLVSNSTTSRSMTNNVVTLNFATSHRFVSGDAISVGGSNPWIAGDYTVAPNIGSLYLTYSTAFSSSFDIGSAAGWTPARTVNVRANSLDYVVYPDLPSPFSTTLSFTNPLVIGSVITANQLGNSAWRYRNDSVEYQWVTGSTANGPWTNIANSTNNTYALTSSDNNYYVNCRVTATNTKGSSPVLATNPVFFTSPLSAPTGLSSSNITSTTATLSWNQVTTATIYEYAYGTSTTFTNWTSVNNLTTVNITGLIANSRYYFSVRAKRNATDVTGAEATAVQFLSKAGPPTLTASVGLGTIENFGKVLLVNTFSQGGGVTGLLYYQVQYAELIGTTLGAWANLALYNVFMSPTLGSPTLTNGKQYKFRSAACDSSGALIGDWSSATDPARTPFGPPGKPTILSPVYGDTGTTMTITWNNNSVVVDGDQVRGWAVSKDNGSTWGVIAAPATNSYTWGSGTPLTTNTSYTFGVKALVGSVSLSGTPRQIDISEAFSVNLVSASYATYTTATTPGVPTSLTVTPSRSGSNPTLNLSWVAPTENGRSPITSYEYRYATATTNLSSELWTDTGSSTTSATINPATPLSKNTTYYAQVRAKNKVGTGVADNSPTNAKSGKTWNVPGAPASISGSMSADGKTATVSWTAPSSDGGTALTGYRTQSNQSVNAGTSWSPLLSTTTLSQSFTSLTAGQRYYFRVLAANNLGDGTFVQVYPATIPVVNSVTATKNTGPSYTASWTGTGNGSAITGYDYERFRNSTSAGVVATTALSVTFTNLSSGSHYVRVRAKNAVGTGPWVASNTITI